MYINYGHSLPKESNIPIRSRAKPNTTLLEIPMQWHFQWIYVQYQNFFQIHRSSGSIELKCDSNIIRTHRFFFSLRISILEHNDKMSKPKTDSCTEYVDMQHCFLSSRLIVECFFTTSLFACTQQSQATKIQQIFDYHQNDQFNCNAIFMENPVVGYEFTIYGLVVSNRGADLGWIWLRFVVKLLQLFWTKLQCHRCQRKHRKDQWQTANSQSCTDCLIRNIQLIWMVLI